jgi:Ca2+-binding EF-hand superfamily protein
VRRGLTGACALGVCALVAACASGAGPPPPRSALNVFISPAGEPFHAGPTEPYPLDQWFARADADHDGAISEAEFTADALAFFERIDANGDGLVDAFEITDYEQQIAPEILPSIARLTARDIPPLPDERRSEGVARIPDQAAADRARERRAGARPSGAKLFGLTGESQPVAASDTDFDGKVSLAEATAAAHRRFVLLDKNHDRKLDRAELKTPAEELALKADKREQSQSRPPR